MDPSSASSRTPLYASARPWSGKGASDLDWSPRTVDVSCLVQLVAGSEDGSGPQQQWQSVSLFDQLDAVIGVSTHVRLRCGVLDERVVVRSVSMKAANELAWPSTVANHPDVLAPVAILNAGLVDEIYLAYPYCIHGTLSEWLLAKSSAGMPTGREETVRLGQAIVNAAIVLGSHGERVSELRADEIFIDSEFCPRLRLRRDSPSSFRGGAHGGHPPKWMAPEEIDIQHTELADIWPIIAYRIGLLLYCIGAQTADPYPNKRDDFCEEGYCSVYFHIPKDTVVSRTLFLGRARHGPVEADMLKNCGVSEMCVLSNQIDKATGSIVIGVDSLQILSSPHIVETRTKIQLTSE